MLGTVLRLGDRALRHPRRHEISGGRSVDVAASVGRLDSVHEGPQISCAQWDKNSKMEKWASTP